MVLILSQNQVCFKAEVLRLCLSCPVLGVHLTFSYSYNFPNVTGGVYSRENTKFHRGKLIASHIAGDHCCPTGTTVTVSVTAHITAVVQAVAVIGWPPP